MGFPYWILREVKIDMGLGILFSGGSRLYLRILIKFCSMMVSVGERVLAVEATMRGSVGDSIWMDTPDIPPT